MTAAAHRRIARRGTGEINSLPPLSVVPLAVPPAKTISLPPLFTVVLLAVPPVKTYSFAAAHRRTTRRAVVVLTAAAVDGRAGGRAASKDVLETTGRDTVSLALP